MAKEFIPKLSPRMEGLVSLVALLADGQKDKLNIADIGCDHGYISIALFQRGLASKVIASDLREGPLLHATKNVAKADLEGKIDVRLGSGLTQVAVGEVDVAIIAGMGGKTILDILEESSQCAKTLEYLIVQPQSEIPEFREALKIKGYNILKNILVCEEDKFYFAMVISSKYDELPERSTADQKEAGVANKIVPSLSNIRKAASKDNNLSGLTEDMDNLFGLDLVFGCPDMRYYLLHVQAEWEKAIEKMRLAKKPDFARIDKLTLDKSMADTALEINTMFCGVDEKFRNHIKAQHILHEEE